MNSDFLRKCKIVIKVSWSASKIQLLLCKPVKHLLHTSQLLLPTADRLKLLHVASHVGNLSIFQRRTTTAGLLFLVCIPTFINGRVLTH